MQKIFDEMIGRWFLYVLENDACGSITKLAKLLGTDYNDAYRMTMRFKDKAGSSRKAVDLLLGYHIRTGRSIDEVFLACAIEVPPPCSFDDFIATVYRDTGEYLEIMLEENRVINEALTTMMQALDELRKIFCLRYNQQYVECEVCPYISIDASCPCEKFALFLKWLKTFLECQIVDTYVQYDDL